MELGSNFDWNGIRSEIVAEYRKGGADLDRATLLQLYKIVMDAVEQSGNLGSEDLESFRKSRREEYNLLLISVCVMPDGNVSPEALRIVTEREVAAGRMSPDDELRTLAIGGPDAIEPAPPSPPKRTGLLGLFRKK
ncbi:MAG TPA: hypothetical protein VG757_07105 [Devosia sp.]|nr:hypothetical protein [Devosia sp.]